MSTFCEMESIFYSEFATSFYDLFEMFKNYFEVKFLLVVAGLHVAMRGPQEVRRGRHDLAESSDGGGHCREPQETLHGRLDLYLHWTRY